MSESMGRWSFDTEHGISADYKELKEKSTTYKVHRDTLLKRLKGFSGDSLYLADWCMFVIRTLFSPPPAMVIMNSKTSKDIEADVGVMSSKKLNPLGMGPVKSSIESEMHAVRQFLLYIDELLYCHASLRSNLPRIPNSQAEQLMKGLESLPSDFPERPFIVVLGKMLNWTERPCSNVADIFLESVDLNGIYSRYLGPIWKNFVTDPSIFDSQDIANFVLPKLQTKPSDESFKLEDVNAQNKKFEWSEYLGIFLSFCKLEKNHLIVEGKYLADLLAALSKMPEIQTKSSKNMDPSKIDPRSRAGVEEQVAKLEAEMIAMMNNFETAFNTLKEDIWDNFRAFCDVVLTLETDAVDCRMTVEKFSFDHLVSGVPTFDEHMEIVINTFKNKKKASDSETTADLDALMNGYLKGLRLFYITVDNDSRKVKCAHLEYLQFSASVRQSLIDVLPENFFTEAPITNESDETLEKSVADPRILNTLLQSISKGLSGFYSHVNEFGNRFNHLTAKNKDDAEEAIKGLEAAWQQFKAEMPCGSVEKKIEKIIKSDFANMVREFVNVRRTTSAEISRCVNAGFHRSEFQKIVTNIIEVFLRRGLVEEVNTVKTIIETLAPARDYLCGRRSSLIEMVFTYLELGVLSATTCIAYAFDEEVKNRIACDSLIEMQRELIEDDVNSKTTRNSRRAKAAASKKSKELKKSKESKTVAAEPEELTVKPEKVCASPPKTSTIAQPTPVLKLAKAEPKPKTILKPPPAKPVAGGKKKNAEKKKPKQILKPPVAKPAGPKICKKEMQNVSDSNCDESVNIAGLDLILAPSEQDTNDANAFAFDVNEFIEPPISDPEKIAKSHQKTKFPSKTIINPPSPSNMWNMPDKTSPSRSVDPFQARVGSFVSRDSFTDFCGKPFIGASLDNSSQFLGASLDNSSQFLGASLDNSSQFSANFLGLSTPCENTPNSPTQKEWSDAYKSIEPLELEKLRKKISSLEFESERLRQENKQFQELFIQLQDLCNGFERENALLRRQIASLYRTEASTNGFSSVASKNCGIPNRTNFHTPTSKNLWNSPCDSAQSSGQSLGFQMFSEKSNSDFKIESDDSISCQICGSLTHVTEECADEQTFVSSLIGGAS